MTTPPGDQPPYGEQPPHGEPPSYGEQPPAQQPYQQYQQPYAQPYPQPYPPYGGYPPGGNVAPPEHPKAMTAMVLGILGLFMCQLASPFAWSIGKRTVAEIDASGGRLGGRGQAQAGYVLGIVGTVFLGLALLFVVGLALLLLVFGVAGVAGSA